MTLKVGTPITIANYVEEKVNGSGKVELIDYSGRVGFVEIMLRRKRCVVLIYATDKMPERTIELKQSQVNPI